MFFSGFEDSHLIVFHIIVDFFDVFLFFLAQFEKGEFFQDHIFDLFFDLMVFLKTGLDG